MSEEKALRKLELLAQPTRLRAVIGALNFGETHAYDVSSCYMNNLAVIKTLTNQEIPRSNEASAVRGFSAVGPPPGMTGRHTKAIMSALSERRLVAFTLKFRKGTSGAGDHYFSAFQLDDDTIVAAMGWQGLYNLTDWFNGKNRGCIDHTTFEELLKRIEEGDIDGVIELCSFAGSTSDGRDIPAALHQELDGCKPTFEATSSFVLPL